MPTPSPSRVAAKAMPIMDPLHNVREVAKQLILLEDHLFHPERHCQDCITKHLLTAEAFAEEARSLDKTGEHQELLTELPDQVRHLFRLFQEGHGPQDVAQATRVLRKSLMPKTWSVRVAAGDAADISRNFPAFQTAHRNFAKAVQDGLDRKLPGDHIAVRRWANTSWVQLMDRGYRIAEGILSTRSIPPRKAKGLEMAYRLFGNSRRMPKDVYKWWQTNEKRIKIIEEAVASWPEKQLGGDDLFEVGSFRVHNTVGAQGAELDSLRRAFETVERLSRSNPVPGFGAVLYGDIHVVGQLTKSHHAAWYKPGDDSLYLRRSKRTGMDEVHAMIHELGHRWFQKRAGAEEKKAWHRHHMRMGMRTPAKLSYPKVGDPLPVKVKGRKEAPVVEKIEQGFYYYQTVQRGRQLQNRIPVRRVNQFIYEQTQREQNFPTGYSSTSPEEHFCEALSLKAQGKLSAEHLEEFDRIWVHQKPEMTDDELLRELGVTASRLAARWLTARGNQEIIEAPHNYHPVKVEPPKAKRKVYPYEGFIDFQGIQIDVENVKGSTRSGDGWSIKMHAHYGEIRGTEGTDGDKLDVYVGDNHDSSVVTVIHQFDPETGRFDEDKVMLGFDSVEEAIGLFKKQYDKPGFYREGEYETMPIGQFWRWVLGDNYGKRVTAKKNTAGRLGDQVYLLRPGAQVSEVLGRAKRKPTLRNKGLNGSKPWSPDVIWTSTLREKDSDWLDWCRVEMPEWVGDEAVVFEPGGRIYYVRNRLDYLNLAKDHLFTSLLHQDEGTFGLNWASVATEWDAVWYSGSGVKDLDTWMVESTVWLNPSVLKYKKTIGVSGRGRSCQFRVAQRWLGGQE